MYRSIEKNLMDWKKNRNQKPLIIKGARQVGKTYSIRKFAKANYDQILEINFEINEDVKRQFELSINPSEVITFLELKYLDIDFSNKNLLLFLDEIQACPRALTALKFLSEFTPFDIIASGSMLGVAIATSSSYPVGYVETLDMYPMDLEEFLRANGVKQKQFNLIKTAFVEGTPLAESIHTLLMTYVKHYILCGGMPAVVDLYIQTKSFAKVRTLQQQIINDYMQDMAKYAIASEKVKVRECFSSIPIQLAKENKKFQYKLVQSGGSARHFESSLQWLKDSGLILKCTRLKTIAQPYDVYQDLSIFKVYMFDIGLLLSQLSSTISQQILHEEAFVYKGAIYENFIAQELQSKQYSLNYFEPSSRSEIDFIVQIEDKLIPIEVKSSKSNTSKSLSAYCEKYNPDYAVKYSFNNIAFDRKHNIHLYPLYMTLFL